MPSRRRCVRPLAALLSAGLVGACAPATGAHSLLGDPSPVGGQVPVTAPPPSAYVTAPATTRASTTTTSSTVAGATTTTTAPAAVAATRPPRPYPVGWTQLNLTDPARPTAFKAGRHLPTYVFYPAVGPAGGAETANAPGLYQNWPVVLFAEGYNGSLGVYHDLVHHLAAAGFVVLFPLFPLETTGGPLNEGDLVNEPGDITYVFDQVLAAGGRPGLLQGMPDSAHLAMVGHSDGAEAVLGAAYLPGQVGARVGPVIVASAQGLLLGNRGGSGVAHAVMVIQGTADTINPASYSDHVYATTPTPKSYLQLIGAPHLAPLSSANQWHGVVESVIVDWLDAWIPGLYSTTAAARLGHDANVAGTSQIRLG
jgi:hypothetical protein